MNPGSAPSPNYRASLRKSKASPAFLFLAAGFLPSELRFSLFSFGSIGVVAFVPFPTPFIGQDQTIRGKRLFFSPDPQAGTAIFPSLPESETVCPPPLIYPQVVVFSKKAFSLELPSSFLSGTVSPSSDLKGWSHPFFSSKIGGSFNEREDKVTVFSSPPAR